MKNRVMRMRRVQVWNVLLMLLMATALHANNNARYAGAYTRIGLGAKALALGSTGVAAPANGHAIYYNPALAGKTPAYEFSNSYNFLSQDRHQLFVGFMMPVKPGGGVAIGWMKTGVSDLNAYNSIGENTGDINFSSHAFYASIARHLASHISIGISFKMFYQLINDGSEEFDYSATGFGADIGVHYQYNDVLSFGVVYKDIGSKLKANTEKIFEQGGTTINYFPKFLRLGSHYVTPLKWLNLNYDFEISSKEEYTNHLGIEALHGRNLALRMGFIDFRQYDERFINVSFGAGFDFKLYKHNAIIDYAFVSGKVDEGSNHVFSFGIQF